MAGDDDDEDFVVYGTPIEREEETSARKRKAVADAGHLRALPAWKQEVRDEEGRRRFHGAFTGGFSAGFYNTVGSKEGWTPQTFTSSRKNRAELKKQSIYSFLDEEDIKDMGGNALETSQQYDTFGFTAAKYARKQVVKEQQERPSSIPGPIPDELVVPATNSIGVKLLMKMGWRQGRSIKEAHADSLYESRREARKAFLALSGNKEDAERDQIDSHKSAPDELIEGSCEEIHASGNTPVYVLQPKQDLHGLGYDPFKHAPEFKDRKKLQKSRNRDDRNDVSVRGRQYAPGFGIGALEELDVDDEDIYASGFAYEQTEVDIEPSKSTSDDKYRLEDRKRGVFLGFKIASNSEYKLERFHPPEIPADFDGRHKFSTPVQNADKFFDSAPPEVPPPEDPSFRLLIEGSAAMVARCGKYIEDFYKERSKANPLFLFLNGGDGCGYYTRKLWEQQQKYIDQQRPDDTKPKSSADKLTAENRGKILGEKPLDRSSKPSSSSISAKEAIQLQSRLGETFTKPISLDVLPESERPFRNDPAKQARFEQFLKDKYQGGLRSANPLPVSAMSDADRARERLDFEAAAEAIEKSKEKRVTDPLSALGLPGISEQRFVSSNQIESSIATQDEKPVYPRREEFEWRPSPMLCKRFDIVDPFMGKPMPVQRPRSKMDTLIFMTESVKGSKSDVESSGQDRLHASQAGTTETGAHETANEPDIEPGATNMQRPVDLYKAIFSDDSDADADEPPSNQPVDPVKTSEGANMVLNRLVAEDFLESLGKELGLEVPPEKPGLPPTINSSFRPETHPKVDTGVSSRKGTMTTACGETEHPPIATGENNKRFADNAGTSGPSMETIQMEVNRANADAPYLFNVEKLDSQYDKQKHRAEKSRSRSLRHRSRSRTPESDSSSEWTRSTKRRSYSRHKRDRTPDAYSSSDSQHSKRKHREKRHRRSYTPDTDSSSGREYHERSKSSARRLSDRHRSRKHSRHHKHRRKDPVEHSEHDRYCSR